MSDRLYIKLCVLVCGDILEPSKDQIKCKVDRGTSNGWEGGGGRRAEGSLYDGEIPVTSSSQSGVCEKMAPRSVCVCV